MEARGFSEAWRNSKMRTHCEAYGFICRLSPRLSSDQRERGGPGLPEPRGQRESVSAERESVVIFSLFPHPTQENATTRAV